ncbi:hypothetical protein [Rubinisphaera italica]|uniref:Uncharacterized protein n=1 Tax=Rubinisphaera italica TaxID=2527969 RepID=A0A5C5XKC2_9PLAN|nr:hypothetical protein [Rubinisphaera italica]TWT63667.1 hypothetical protein Pan54_44220 [Rubinisphaera italica]
MNLEEFKVYVRHSFHFLIVEYGFIEVPAPKRKFINKFMVCYSTDVTWIGIEGIHHGFDIDVRLASTDLSLMKYPSYCLDDLLLIRDPQFKKVTAQNIDTRDIQKRQIDQYAEVLKILADDVLRGDFESFPLLAKAIDDRKSHKK